MAQTEITNEQRLGLLKEAKELLDKAKDLVAQAGCELMANGDSIVVTPCDISFDEFDEEEDCNSQDSDEFISECPTLLSISSYYDDECECRVANDVPKWWKALGKKANKVFK